MSQPFDLFSTIAYINTVSAEGGTVSMKQLSLLGERCPSLNELRMFCCTDIDFHGLFFNCLM